jgi:hypothetical protein
MAFGVDNAQSDPNESDTEDISEVCRVQFLYDKQWMQWWNDN